MKSITEIQNIINKSDYWDCRVKSVECNYFADEIRITYYNNSDNLVCYEFDGCYNSYFDHVKEYDKKIPVKDMNFAQKPYFMQDVSVEETIDTKSSKRFIVCKINMFPLYIELWCENIIISTEDRGTEMSS